MKVSVEHNIVWMTVPPHELDLVRGLPHRAYDPGRCQWRAPVTPRVSEYLCRVLDEDGCHRVTAAVDAFRPKPLPAGYVFKTTPRDYQRKHLERMQNLAAYAVFFDPGLGKSKVFIDDACIAQGQGIVAAAAVVCPNSITSNWEDEIAIHSPVDADVFVYSPQRKKAAAAWIAAPSQRMKWFIIAVESLSSGEGKKFLEAFLREQPASLGIDESSRIKSHDATRTKVMQQMAPLAPRRRILTGTAFTQGIQDGWSQYNVISPRILNGMNYFAFRNFFCQMAPIPGGVVLDATGKPALDAQGKQIPRLGPDGKPLKPKGQMIVGAKNEDLLVDLTAYYTGLERKEDCLDLPPKVYQTRKIEPSAAQLKAITELTKSGMTEVDGGMMSFTNVLVKYLRIQQLCGGFATVEDDLARVFGQQNDIGVDEFFEALERGEAPVLLKKFEKCRVTPLPGVNPKIEEMLQVIEETPGKILIWCRFRPEIEAVHAALSRVHGPQSAVQFHGDCDNDERTLARRRLQSDPECRFFVGQSRTGGIGITLTAAESAYYFSNDWSLETRIQSEDRNHRIGTTGTVVYTDFILDYPKSLDQRILTALRSGRSFVEDLKLQMKEKQL